MNLSDEQFARVALTTFSEPGDTVTGKMLRLVGAAETLRLVSAVAPLPDTIDQTAGELWRARLSPRMRDAEVERVIDDTEQRGLVLLTPDDPRWPPALAPLGIHSPVALWSAGNDHALVSDISRLVAIVGPGAATSYGEHVAAELSSELAGGGVNIVSGGAYGIDGAAHRGGDRIPNRRYDRDSRQRAPPPLPRWERALVRADHDRRRCTLERAPAEVIANSLEIHAAQPNPRRPCRRHVVVEAGARSGALDIAARAHALGRSVGAVPGPITSAASTGCHRLLRERIATVVTNAHEVRELLGRRAAARQPEFDRAPSLAVRRRAEGLTL